MIPKVGDGFMLDLGYEGKVRPILILSREGPNATRALSVFVALTKHSRGSRYEVILPRAPWLKLQSYVDAQDLGTAGWHELTEKRGRFEPAVVEQVNAAVRYSLNL